jgi:hypothetical protein
MGVAIRATIQFGTGSREVVALQFTLTAEVSGSRARMHGTQAGRPLDPKKLTESLQRGSHWVGGRSCRGLCEAFLAPRVLIKEATADVEILVIAGWQGGPFVFGKPLRESDHSAGRRRWPA